MHSQWPRKMFYCVLIHIAHIFCMFYRAIQSVSKCIGCVSVQIIMCFYMFLQCLFSLQSHNVIKHMETYVTCVFWTPLCFSTFDHRKCVKTQQNTQNFHWEYTARITGHYPQKLSTIPRKKQALHQDLALHQDPYLLHKIEGWRQRSIGLTKSRLRTFGQPQQRKSWRWNTGIGKRMAEAILH